MFVTPGPYATFAPPDVPRRPTIGMSTYPLPFHLWAAKYEAGDALRITTVHQVPGASWPAELKCRSRMHYYLADREVRKNGDSARPLLLDENGYLNETPTANIVWHSLGHPDAGNFEYLGTVAENKALNGISQMSLVEIGKRRFGLRNLDADLRPSGVKLCAEFMITSTPFCVLPIVKIDDAPIGDGRPGPTFQKLLAAWSEEVGVDIAEQARRFAVRGS
jgi:branched-subunit amino acid aminotransferase/4-amino-4-deoxychorismate lyase